MASTTPLVHDDVLIETNRAGEHGINVGSNTWWNWLAASTTTTFHYRIAAGSFTARKERRRGGWYWYAYRKQSGHLFKSYLGRSEDLTPVHLAAVAGALDQREATPSTLQATPDACPPGHLPLQPGRLVGREAQVVAIAEILRQPSGRMVTLTGTGGTGKTRLALAVAERLSAHFVDGVWFVDLSTISDPAHVVPAIARVLSPRWTVRRPTTAHLCDTLGHSRALLVLDNFEQVLDGAAAVAEVLSICPGVAVLATSREPLRIRWEQQCPVPSLELPDLRGDLSPDVLIDNPAVVLFMDRACTAMPEFNPNGEDARRVAEICVRLDGLPLAIELIAARVTVLSLQSILARLGQPLELAGRDARDRPARHRTLREAIAWSHDLLDDTQQAVFRRLAVFVGGCTFEAAVAICGAARDAGHADVEQPILDLLASLIDKGLLRHTVEQDGTSRYRMLETIHAFARECLASSGETETIQRRHATYYLAQAMTAVDGSEPLANRSADGMDEELDNFRAILEWSLTSGDPETGLRLAEVLAGRWAPLGLHQEGRRWLAALLARAPEPTGARASGLNATAYLALRQGDYAAASAVLEESVVIARHIGDERRLARAHLYQGMVAHALGRPEQALAFYDASLRFLRAIDDEASMTGVLRNLADLLYEQQDLEQARATYEETLAIARRIGHTHDAAYAQRGLGHVARAMGELQAAAELYRTSLLVFHRMDDRRCIPFCVEGLACLASAAGAAERAVRLYGAAQALRDAIGVVLPPAERVDHEQGLASARARLDEHEFTLAWQAGGAMDIEQALRYALVPLTTPDRGDGAGESGSDGTLTRRESGVAGLIATGLTNREIAAALVIAVGTAERHVSNILDKLGFSSRAQIAAWAARQHGPRRSTTPRR